VFQFKDYPRVDFRVGTPSMRDKYDVIHAHLLLRVFVFPLVFAQSARRAFALIETFPCALELLARCSVARF
jgi:hypothetical protein